MLDRIDACLDRFSRRLIAMAMHRHFFAQPVRFIDQRRHFRRRELRRIHFVRQRKNAARNGGLDHIRAIFHFEAHRLANLVRTIDNAVRVVRFAPKKQIAITTRRIKMTARRADSFGRNQHPRADDDSFVDRVAQRNIDKLAAAHIATSDVAHRCESGFHGRTCEDARPDRHFRNVRR